MAPGAFPFLGSQRFGKPGMEYFAGTHFNPNCTYRFGPQKWIGATYNDTCYEDKNSTAVGHDFTLHGQLKNYIEIPYKDTFNITENITIRVNATSECSAEEKTQTWLNTSELLTTSVATVPFSANSTL